MDNRTVIIFIIFFLVSMIAILIILLGLNSAHPKPFNDEKGKLLKGSLSEKIFVTINGRKQGMIIKSRDIRNPVLFYLHGGLPDYFF